MFRCPEARGRCRQPGPVHLRRPPIPIQLSHRTPCGSRDQLRRRRHKRSEGRHRLQGAGPAPSAPRSDLGGLGPTRSILAHAFVNTVLALPRDGRCGGRPRRLRPYETADDECFRRRPFGVDRRPRRGRWLFGSDGKADGRAFRRRVAIDMHRPLGVRERPARVRRHRRSHGVAPANAGALRRRSPERSFIVSTMAQRDASIVLKSVSDGPGRTRISWPGSPRRSRAGRRSRTGRWSEAYPGCPRTER